MFWFKITILVATNTSGNCPKVSFKVPQAIKLICTWLLEFVYHIVSNCSRWLGSLFTELYHHLLRLLIKKSAHMHVMWTWYSSYYWNVNVVCSPWPFKCCQHFIFILEPQLFFLWATNRFIFSATIFRLPFVLFSSQLYNVMICKC